VSSNDIERRSGPLANGNHLCFLQPPIAPAKILERFLFGGDFG
jgi:hypothetical protein